MINTFVVYEASLHYFNNKPIILFTTTYYAAFCLVTAFI